MTAFVLDASCAIGSLLADESHTATEAMLRRLSDETPWVPVGWFAEIGNALEMARRRRRIDVRDVAEALDILGSWDVSVDIEEPFSLLARLLELSRRSRLTVYDATYLELAVRRKLPLATLDKDLARAAREAGVTLLLA